MAFTQGKLSSGNSLHEPERTLSTKYSDPELAPKAFDISSVTIN